MQRINIAAAAIVHDQVIDIGFDSFSFNLYLIPGNKFAGGSTAFIFFNKCSWSSISISIYFTMKTI